MLAAVFYISLREDCKAAAAFSQATLFESFCHHPLRKRWLCAAWAITHFRKMCHCVACDIISGYSESLRIKWFSGFWRKTALFQSYDFKSTQPFPSLKHHFSLPEGSYIMSLLDIAHALRKRLMSPPLKYITLRNRPNGTTSDNDTSVIYFEKYNGMLQRIMHSAKMT